MSPELIIDLLHQRKNITSIDHVFRVGDWLYFNAIYTVLNIAFYNIRTQELRISTGMKKKDGLRKKKKSFLLSYSIKTGITNNIDIRIL
jgi:hypothetical protein